ncbi:MAG: hypothetical protein IJZ68_09100 [Bacteroidaceae bacterium]|nr:hypothetical protein [Bacteroidaceae bacterium]
MNIKEFAENLGTRPTGDEVPYHMVCEAQHQRYLVIFGASDDLVEICGHHHYEFDAFRPTTLYVTRNRVYSSDEIHPTTAKPIHVEYSTPTATNPALWKLTTEIPHATYNIMDGDELFCKGLVIDLNNLE